MKILFVDGRFTQNGWECVHRNGRTKCGEFVNNTTEHFKIVSNRRVVARRDKEKIVRVVKQKSRWKTFRILCHELAHWLFDFLPDKLENKLDDWLDR